MTPGEMLRTVRELQEMSQSDLALASHVSQPAISAMEGGATIGRDRAVKLARALQVHPAVLMFPDWDPTPVREVLDMAAARARVASRFSKVLDKTEREIAHARVSKRPASSKESPDVADKKGAARVTRKVTSKRAQAE
jgi:transcriptional regulator with XRE-family HTH domain